MSVLCLARRRHGILRWGGGGRGLSAKGHHFLHFLSRSELANFLFPSPTWVPTRRPTVLRARGENLLATSRDPLGRTRFTYFVIKKNTRKESCEKLKQCKLLFDLASYYSDQLLAESRSISNWNLEMSLVFCNSLSHSVGELYCCRNIELRCCRVTES